MCKVCGAVGAHTPVKFHRCCHACHTRWFCESCNEMANQADVVDCLLCSKALAAWCGVTVAQCAQFCPVDIRRRDLVFDIVCVAPTQNP